MIRTALTHAANAIYYLGLLFFALLVTMWVVSFLYLPAVIFVLVAYLLLRQERE